MNLRDFSPEDYPAITNIHNALYPARSRTPDGWARSDACRNPKCKFRRWASPAWATSACRFGTNYKRISTETYETI
jgi:hypothetical protein